MQAQRITEPTPEIDAAQIQALRTRMSAAGITVAELARELGVHRKTVIRLLSGRSKGVRGTAHDAAVRLGLKPSGMVRDEGLSIIDIARGAANV